jgi:hypothetical protein
LTAPTIECKNSSASEAPNPGRHQVGTPGDIISECPGDFVGMLEGSNRSRVTGIARNSVRDLFEAGLNEAAFVEHCLWALDQRDDGAIMSPRPQSGSIANKIPAIDRSNHRVVADEVLLVAEVD